MTASKSNPVLAPHNQAPTLSGHARAIVLTHGERILAEVPKTLRRFGLLMLVLAISIPAFFAGLLVVLWHLAK